MDRIITSIKSWWFTFQESGRAKTLSVWARRAMIVAILALIGWNLADIGWMEVLRSLPTQPLFYLIFILIYINLPLAELLIYGQLWTFRKRDGFRAFLTKRVYNNEVVGYSGEFYLYLWASKKLGVEGKQALANIRDCNIISAGVSYLVAFSLVAALVWSGVLNLEEYIGEVDWIYVAAGGLLLIALIVLALQFRRHLFSMPARIAIRIFAVYILRFLFQHSLLVLQWMVVIQGAPISVWLTFVAVYIVVNRLPFFPSKDLMFAWAGIELSKHLGVGSAEVAGMLLVYSALNKLGNLASFGILTYLGDDPKKPEQ